MKESDARGLEVPADPPDGPLSGAIWRHDRRRVAATAHATFEGHPVDVRAVLESYDRNEHPWIHAAVRTISPSACGRGGRGNSFLRLT